MSEGWKESLEPTAIGSSPFSERNSAGSVVEGLRAGVAGIRKYRGWGGGGVKNTSLPVLR
jgi:hypothetical protein